MGTELFFIAVIILVIFAVFDLMVGISNDAVNFLNSSIGSRVAPRHIIMIIASLGILAGVTFSSGMMEVARKGIFHPGFFTMPQLMTIFLAVMFTDVILLDLFNTFGLPTSTTVSIVFELLGAAVAVSILKIIQSGDNLLILGQYINTAKAMLIIFGILLSVIVAFIFGGIIQFLSRLLFTFDYVKRLKRYGALWGGIALASITYFILVKGAKGASFITPENAKWINSHAFTLLVYIFAASAIIMQILIFCKINILKPIVLIGTFAIAMSFAANDLVNFIGVPMAGLHSYEAAMGTNSPLSVTMEALSGKVRAETYLLLIAGLIMVITLWFSRKARTVSETEITLAQQEEGTERFESFFLARIIVRMVIGFFTNVKRLVPMPIQKIVTRRLDTSNYQATVDKENRPSFDLIRASVNLMVASAIISYATSYKLPLSTTYITFMVAMGTSFADQAWGRESAVYRVSGVLAVIGGWFFTAFMAFTVSCLLAVLIFYAQAYAIFGLPLLVGFIVWRTHHKHKERVKRNEDRHVFNLKKIQDAPKAITETFKHMAHLLKEIRESLDRTMEALFAQNEYGLRQERKAVKKTQFWVNIIIANVFKAMRLLQKDDAHISPKYAQATRRLQKLSDGHRDIVLRAHIHVSNHHKGLLDVQIKELKQVKEGLLNILLEVENRFNQKRALDYEAVIKKDKELRALSKKFNQSQIERITDETSKTRLTILFYTIVGNAMMLSKQNLKLLEIFEESFGKVAKDEEFDLD